MKIKDHITKELTALLKKYETLEMDVSELYETLAKEGTGLLPILVESLFQIALKQKKIINSFGLITRLHKKAYLYIGQPANQESTEEVKKGIILSKDLTITILEKLNLTKSKEAYINELIAKDEEIDANKYLSKELIQKLRDKNFSYFEETLKKEFEEKLRNKPKIIKVE